MKKIAIIFGGTSSEYEISLESAASIVNVLESNRKYQLYKIGISRQGKWYLTNATYFQIQNGNWVEEFRVKEVLPQINGKGFFIVEDNEYLKPDILFPVLHGGNGENGVLQGLFEMMQIPYVGCGVEASSICMNKYMLHQFANSVGIKSTPTMLISSLAAKNKVENFCKENGFPIYVKPNTAGSSKGISVVTSYEELEKGLKDAFAYSEQVIVQKNVEGTEIGCGVLGNKEIVMGACDEIFLQKGFFDYQEKYQMVTAKIIVPAQIPTNISEEIKRQAVKIFKALGCKGLARLDFFLTKEGAILLNEINTFPGFTAHSRYPGMFLSIGISYSEIINKLIFLAEEAYNEKQLFKVSEPHTSAFTA